VDLDALLNRGPPCSVGCRQSPVLSAINPPPAQAHFPEKAPRGAGSPPGSTPSRSPARRASGGGLKKLHTKAQSQESRGGANLFKLWRATDLIPAKRGSQRSARGYARTIRCHLASGFQTFFGAKGKYSVHRALTKFLTNHPMFCSDSINCANLLNLGVLSHATISVGGSPSYVSSGACRFCPVLSRNRYLTSVVLYRSNLVTGDSTGAVFLTTRPTREGKYQRALEFHVRGFGIAHRRGSWFLQIRFVSSRLEVLEVSCDLP